VSDPVPLTESLDSLMRSLHGADRRQVSGVFGRWDDAVGADVARHVQPVRLDRGALTVEVDDAAWATQVRFLTDTIVGRLRDVAGVEVASIDVRVRRDVARGVRPSSDL
jgi:predicted nucleic acid-binding Zn ribbon protein